VEALQPDAWAALDFYGPLFGWEFAGPGPMPGDVSGEYFVARVKGRDALDTPGFRSAVLADPQGAAFSIRAPGRPQPSRAPTGQSSTAPASATIPPARTPSETSARPVDRMLSGSLLPRAEVRGS
jgi:hypothetical protein